MPNVDEILEGARDAMTVGRVYGDSIEQDGVTVVGRGRPGGGGGGGDDTQNGGAGFGLKARPVGAYVICGKDVTWVPAVDVTGSCSTASLRCCSAASCCAADSALQTSSSTGTRSTSKVCPLRWTVTRTVRPITSPTM